jgi:hypothetical protein
MSITGDDSSGWTWRVWVDDLELFRTEPLERADLGAALFSIQRDSSRRNPHLLGVPDDILFVVLDEFFFGSLYDALRPAAEEQTWARHLVSPTVPAVIWSKMYLVGAKDKQERLLVSRDGSRHNFVLVEGDFDRELEAVRKHLEVA